MLDLFFRAGAQFTGKPTINEKGKPVVVRAKQCARCGGAGFSDKWIHTGRVCFDCNGAGTRGHEAVRLFTAVELDKLNATAAKKAATKLAAAQAAQAAHEAEVEARRAAFIAQHGALLDRAEAFRERDAFVADVVSKAHARAALTEGQEVALRNAIDRIVARDAQKAGSQFIGAVGERITLTVKCERIVTIQTAFGAMNIVTMRADNGAAIVAKGRFIPAGARWDRDRERWVVPTEALTITATVKGHDTFRDERQTQVQRVKETPALNEAA